MRRGAAALFSGLFFLLAGESSAFAPAAAGLSRLQPTGFNGRGMLGRRDTSNDEDLRITGRTASSCGADRLRCAVSVSPNSIYSAGDWGLLLPPAEQPKRPALPRLTTTELRALLAGERVQRQSRVGPVGHGLVVMDVHAEMSTVLAVLSDVQRYPQRIDTVREAVVHPCSHRNMCKARFKLSRFKLDVQVELYRSNARNMLEFRLDKSAGMQGAAFDEARGYWFLEPCPEREQGWTRVWLNARVQCSPLLPASVIDLAATKALPRATTWLAPVCEAVEGELQRKSGPAGVWKDVHSVGLGFKFDK